MASKKPWSAFALAMVLMANLLPLVAALPNLRIMPLGDSITKGSGSNGIVGYRGPLRRKLLSQGKDDGITVDMIGSLTDGNMPDNNHEGHSGRYLDEINTYWKLSIKARPNLVLIHAGINNMDKNRDLDIALDIYRNMIDGIFTEAPEVTILVAPVIWANKPAMQVNSDNFNPQLEALIKLRQQQGKRILPVPIDIGPGDLWDEKHPNDKGYEKIANAWLNAILEADSRGYLEKPVAMTDDDEDDDDNDTNKCTSAPKTYSKKQIDRVGEYMDWEKMEWTNSAIVGVQYVTIVNLTPHKFIYDIDGSNSYQMTNWDFADIPQGKARQNAVEYSSTAGSKVDSKGEAYYSIDGTRDKFVVRVTNHEFALHPKRIVFDLNDMGAGSREYNCPQVETPVTLVITGSADYEHGYITSLVHGGAGWMQSIKDVIKDRRLNEIVIPGTHDAGMSRISNGLLSLGSADNTQTQNLNIKGQLEAGSRWFDIRIASVHKPGNDNYDFWAVHVNKELGNPAIGAAGEKLSEVIDEINEFTSKNPGEVIILQTRALMGLDQSPRGPILWDNGLKEDFFDKLRRINNRCPNLNHENSFETYKIGTLMGQNKGKGCVLIFLNTGNLEEKIEEKDRISEKDGIYNKDSIKLTDAWPNKRNTEDMAEWAVTEWKKEKTDMYIGQWVVTANYAPGGETRSILQTSVLATNPALYWRGVNEMSPTAFPNVLLVDYIGNVLLNVNEPDWDDLSAEMQVLAIGLNLYMISENCKINSQRPPFFLSRTVPYGYTYGLGAS